MNEDERLLLKASSFTLTLCWPSMLWSGIAFSSDAFWLLLISAYVADAVL
jgi:hypothetical protein